MATPKKNNSRLVIAIYAAYILAIVGGLGYAVTFRQDAQQSVKPN